MSTLNDGNILQRNPCDIEISKLERQGRNILIDAIDSPVDVTDTKFWFDCVSHYIHNTDNYSKFAEDVKCSLIPSNSIDSEYLIDKTQSITKFTGFIEFDYLLSFYIYDISDESVRDAYKVLLKHYIEQICRYAVKSVDDESGKDTFFYLFISILRDSCYIENVMHRMFSFVSREM